MATNEETKASASKSLIVFRDTNDTDNLFVPLLCNAICAEGIDVHCSVKDFWESTEPYAVIHFQWPEEVVGWNCNDSGIIRKLEERFHFFRMLGTRFIYTRHNARPHYTNEIISRAYDIIESQSDIIVHMGRFSLQEFIQSHPNGKNVIIPHHIYQYTYKEDITKEEARLHLKLPQTAFIVTAFGKFRNQEERRMVLDAFSGWKEPRKLLLAPRFYPFSKQNNYGSNLLKRSVSRFGYHLLVPLLNRILKLHAGASDELVDNADVPYYIAASDVILIQRKDILNSGNIPLAFLYRKVVAGPKVGNIQEWLEETGNPTFSPDSKEEIRHAIKEAYELSLEGHGDRNYRYALERMSLQKVGKAYAQLYREAGAPLSSATIAL